MVLEIGYQGLKGMQCVGTGTIHNIPQFFISILLLGIIMGYFIRQSKEKRDALSEDQE